MSHFKAKMHQIIFAASVRPSVRLLVEFDTKCFKNMQFEGIN